MWSRYLIAKKHLCPACGDPVASSDWPRKFAAPRCTRLGGSCARVVRSTSVAERTTFTSMLGVGDRSPLTVGKGEGESVKPARC
jgi:hypothetical protein